jgi:hypothetical protein
VLLPFAVKAMWENEEIGRGAHANVSLPVSLWLFHATLTFDSFQYQFSSSYPAAEKISSVM